MVFSKLFGGGKKPPEGKPQVRRWLESLDPMWRAAVTAIAADKTVDEVFKQDIYRCLQAGQLDAAREAVRKYFQFMSPETRERVKYAGQHEAWADSDALRDAGIITPTSENDPVDSIIIGELPLEDDLRPANLLFHGEGHLLTVAPTGAGKGQRFVIPTLLDFEGPVVVLDPKGENYAATAWRRNLYGQVYKWAPGEDDSDCYNPLDAVRGWDDARLLAELLIVQQSREPFWDEAAKDLLTGLIFFVLRTRPPERRNMREVCRCLTRSKADFKTMIETLQSSSEERLQELGNILESRSENLHSSIATTLLTQLAPWRADEIVATTSSSTPGWSVETILVKDNMGVTFAAQQGRPPGWHSPAPGRHERGMASSVYLIVPPEQIGAYRSVLRVMLGQHLSEAIKWRADIERNNKLDDELPESFPDWPMMFYLDELPQLGYMRIIEEAVAITRSYRVRLWLFTQDMAQLKEVYPKWESLLANCRCQIFFRPNDMNTATEIANRLGMRKDIWGGEDWVASPQKLMGREFREDAVIFFDGLMIRSRMVRPAFDNPTLQAWIAEQKRDFGEEVLRAPRAEAPMPARDDELDAPPSGGSESAAPTKSEGSQREDADLADNPEYQRRLAALQAEMRNGKTETSSPSPEKTVRPPERPAGSSDKAKPPPMPPSFDE
ncbi:MAG: type IV secretory system conjugative DNA transfer family protein [Rhodospirillales bacterium]|nr:type IV secretory system conjugative DNA transfer family protein [Rhodospirillales bacterium]